MRVNNTLFFYCLIYRVDLSPKNNAIYLKVLLETLGHAANLLI